MPARYVCEASDTTINGAFATMTTGYASSLSGKHVINFDGDKAATYDMTIPMAERIPTVTVTEWND